MVTIRFLWVMAAVLFVAASCDKVAVRDATVYKAEVDFVSAASEETIENGKAVIEKFCFCKDGAWTTVECEHLAETVVVLQARMAYHTSFMLYLGGMSEERPAKDPPEIPENASLCPSSLTDVPMKLPVELGGGE